MDADKIEKVARNYIKEAAAQGHDYEVIRAALLKHKYPKDIVNKIISEEKTGTKPEKIIPKKPSFFENLKQNNKVWELYLGIGVAVVLIIVVIFYVINYQAVPTTQVCSTNDCFIQAADNCEPVMLDLDENGTVYSLVSTSGCTFTKAVKSVSPSEPDEIKNLFENKSLQCNYTKNNFNTNWVEKLSIGIENCTGDLKDSIYTLIAAQLTPGNLTA